MNFKLNILTVALLSSTVAAFAPISLKTGSKTELASSFFDNVNLMGGQTAETMYSGGGGGKPADVAFGKLIDAGEPTNIQGGALRTWTYKDPLVDRVLVSLVSGGPTEGNPCKANIQVCQGPDNTPLQCDLYSGKGAYRKIRLGIETPRSHSAVFVRNTNSIEYPFTCRILPCTSEPNPSCDLPVVGDSLYDMVNPRVLQGASSVISYPLDSSVNMCKVIIKTDGRPLDVMIELIQGPNAPKYTMNIYTEDGVERPFYTILETPGAGNMVRVKNVHQREFPCLVDVEPYEDELVPAVAFKKTQMKPKPLSQWNM